MKKKNEAKTFNKMDNLSDEKFKALEISLQLGFGVIEFEYLFK